MTPRIPVRFWSPRLRPKRLRWNALTLEWGLQEFYQSQAGATFLRSWNETETLVANPLQGFNGTSTDAGGEYPYVAVTIQYLVLPFRDSAERIYAGLVYQTSAHTPDENVRIEWLTWSTQPGWVTGFTIVRLLEGVPAGHRQVTSPTMFGGWTDDGTGWVAGLPFGYANPPKVAKALWCVNGWLGSPVAMNTVSCPIGGMAFRTGGTQKLVRMMVDPLRRNRNGTLAAWVNLGPSSGVALGVRGKTEGNFTGTYAAATNTLNLCANAISAVDMQSNDWGLLVLRNDAGANRLRVDFWRLRDGRRFNAAVSLIYEPLTGGSDYYQEGLLSSLGVGGSFRQHNNEALDADRVGVWNRALSDADVELLWNNGAGWSPE